MPIRSNDIVAGVDSRPATVGHTDGIAPTCYFLCKFNETKGRRMTETLDAGHRAPDFSLPGDGGVPVRLADLAGRRIALFFYPKDDTSGCTQEAREFDAFADQFAAANCLVFGISPDPVKSHSRFKEKHGLRLNLLSDETKNTLQAFGVWKEKTMYGRKYMGVERSTFLIGEDGRIARAWRNAKVPGHAADVLAAARALA